MVSCLHNPSPHFSIPYSILLSRIPSLQINKKRNVVFTLAQRRIKNKRDDAKLIRLPFFKIFSVESESIDVVVAVEKVRAPNVGRRSEA
jgi:hypothetical protein